jgi:hypothetical protein
MGLRVNCPRHSKQLNMDDGLNSYLPGGSYEKCVREGVSRNPGRSDQFQRPGLDHNYFKKGSHTDYH